MVRTDLSCIIFIFGSFKISVLWLDPTSAAPDSRLTFIQSESDNDPQQNCGWGSRDPHQQGGPLLAPWMVSVMSFIHGRPEFLGSGVLVGASTILTIFRNSYVTKGPEVANGSRSNKEWRLPPANTLRILAGGPGEPQLWNKRHVQHRTANHISPYLNSRLQTPSQYQFFLIHVSQSFNLSTGHVGVICLPLTSDLLDPSSTFSYDEYITGFSSGPSGELIFEKGLQKDSNSNLTSSICSRRDIKWTSTERICRRIGSSPYNTTTTCVRHGASLVYQKNHQWFLKGIIYQIPRTRDDKVKCLQNSSYVIATLKTIQNNGSRLRDKDLTHEFIRWINNGVKCSPSGFPCHNGTCISLSRVCNSIKECSSGEDEVQIYCEARECSPFCGSNRNDQKVHHGSIPTLVPPTKRVIPTQIPISSTSTPRPRVKGSENPRRVSFCPQIPITRGVTIECRNKDGTHQNCTTFPEGTQVTLNCKAFYEPKLPRASASGVRMTCGSGGQWQNYRNFFCQPECGTSNNISSRSYVPPWHAVLFSYHAGEYKFICGGTLIDERMVLTAGNCLMSLNAQSAAPYRYFKVIVGPSSSNFSENLESSSTGTRIFNVQRFYRPSDYSPSPLQSNIAILILEKPVVFTQRIRPVCLMEGYPIGPPRVGDIGELSSHDWIPGQRNEFKKKEFKVVPTSKCQSVLGNSSFESDQFCGAANSENEGQIRNNCPSILGEGLYFSEPWQKGQTKYFLKGIVSKYPTSRARSCSGSLSPVLFTKIDDHKNFIFTHLDKLLYES